MNETSVLLHDRLILLNACQNEVRRLHVILIMFEVLTGLKLNLEKSSITSVGADNIVEGLALELGCKTDSLPVTYLGMPVGATRRNEAVWDVIIERMEKKLAPWKRKHLNKAGRLALIKSSLSGLPTYFLSLLVLPTTVELKLNSIMGRFLWGENEENRKMVWVAWEKVCRPKIKGGFGVRGLRAVNKSLLAKWHWRYTQERTALWRTIISEKTSSGQECLVQLNSKEAIGRSMWQEIEKAKKDFYGCVEYQIGNGRATRFWHDWWVQQYSFAEKYPRIYKLSCQQEATVEAMFDTDWRFEFRRRLNPAENIDLLELKYELRNVQLQHGMEDQMRGNFTAKKLYDKLMEVFPDCNFVHLLGGKHVPPKVSFVVWACMHHSLPTRSMLQHRGMNIHSNLCLFCKREVETTNHLMVHCEWARNLWDYFLDSLKVKWVMSDSFENHLRSWRMTKFNKKRFAIWTMLPYVIIWQIWEQRNARIYGGKLKSKTDMITATKLGLQLWCSPYEVFSGYSATQILFSWETIVNL